MPMKDEISALKDQIFILEYLINSHDKRIQHFDVKHICVGDERRFQHFISALSLEGAVRSEQDNKEQPPNTFYFAGYNIYYVLLSLKNQLDDKQRAFSNTKIQTALLIGAFALGGISLYLTGLQTKYQREQLELSKKQQIQESLGPPTPNTTQQTRGQIPNTSGIQDSCALSREIQMKQGKDSLGKNLKPY